MLDLDHPMTEHIFAASRAADRVLERAKCMTLAPSSRRLELLESCRADLAQMRQLNSAHFEASPFIFGAIDELEAALQELANLKDGLITEDKSSGTGDCPACGTPITNFKTNGLSREYFKRVRNLTKSDKDFAEQLTPRPEEYTDHWHTYCGNCLNLIGPAREKLDSTKGFGTCFI